MTFIGDLERFFAEFIFPYRVPVGVGLALALTAVAVLAWRRRWDRPLLRHPVGTMAVAVPMLLVIGSAAWFLGSPLVIRTELVEAGAMTSGLLSGEFQGA
ncbi:MAG: hypothetical protein ACRDG7_15440, partial [Candidatus Limnocylindria bacterium]